MRVTEVIKGLVPSALRRKIKQVKAAFVKPDFTFTSYSQEGEDLILRNYFDGMGPGFFVDIGAHHPVRFSNTYFFYKRGWRGINIDALPGSMTEFKKMRPLDINLEQAVSDKYETLPFYIFNESAVNTLSKDVAKKFQEQGWVLTETKEIKTKPINDILNEHVKGRKIDLMTIDVEGYELNILKSLDFEKYRPGMILVEDLNFSFTNFHDNPIHQFLTGKDYTLRSKTCNTLFYSDDYN